MTGRDLQKKSPAPCPERYVDLDLGRDDCVLKVERFVFCTDGVKVDGIPSFEDWQFAMEVLGTVNRRIVKPFRLWVGQMLLLGESRYGETYAQAIEQTGYQYQTLANIRSTLRRYLNPDGTFNPKTWHANLSFEHHSIVAADPPDEREGWLERCERERLNTDELREARKGGKTKIHKFCCPACGTEFETNAPVVIKRTIKRGKELR